jgi:hypothetical protein
MGSQFEEYTLENPGRRAQNDARLKGVLMYRSRLFSTSVLIAAAALAAGAWGASSNSAHKVYKWVDDQGVTHYGDQIPPEYAAQAHGVMNNQGIEVEHTDAQKTPEELAAEDRKRLDTEQRANRDRNLLTTYGSVQEIERLRDQRLSLLTDQIKLKEQFLESLNVKMNKLKVTTSRYKPYSGDPKAPPMTDQLTEDLVRVGSDIRTQEENLRQKRTEQANMNQEFEGDIARFKELKGIH